MSSYRKKFWNVICKTKEEEMKKREKAAGLIKKEFGNVGWSILFFFLILCLNRRIKNIIFRLLSSILVLNNRNSLLLIITKYFRTSFTAFRTSFTANSLTAESSFWENGLTEFFTLVFFFNIREWWNHHICFTSHSKC